MNSILGFFVGIFQTVSVLLGISHPAPAIPVDIATDTKIDQTLTPQQVVDHYGTLPKGLPTNALSLSASPGTGHAPLDVHFEISVDMQNNADGYAIDFGDQSSGMFVVQCKGDIARPGVCAGAAALHTYTNPGRYSVQVKNTSGEIVATKVISVSLSGYKDMHEGALINELNELNEQNEQNEQLSVPAMSKYTDKDFGFSFWYPNGWTVKESAVSEHQVYEHPGGIVSKQLVVKSPTDKNMVILIEEFISPTMTITDSSGVGACPVCVAMRYYFDASSHTWMLEFPNGSEAGLPAGTPRAADTTQNTMGGLHMFGGSQRFGANRIIPLSAHNFLLVSVSGYMATEMNSEKAHALTKTIVALDPTVATPVSTKEQTITIQAEKNDYTGQ